MIVDADWSDPGDIRESLNKAREAILGAVQRIEPQPFLISGLRFDRCVNAGWLNRDGTFTQKAMDDMEEALLWILAGKTQ